KPIADFCASEAPALVVMIRMTLRKSTCLPLWSVSLPWSITCRRMLNRSGCAFSISSRRSTQCGCWSMTSVNSPPGYVGFYQCGRRADEARDGVPLHVLRHVEPQELDAERQRQLLCDLGLA